MNPLLGRWISADPLAVHAPGEADANLYAYVSGQVLKNVDPLGLDGEATESTEPKDMSELSRAFEYGQIARDVYKDKSALEDSPWRRLTGEELEKTTGMWEGTFEQETSGFFSAIYKNDETGKYVLAFRGTTPTSPKDIVSDVNQALGTDEQYRHAMRVSAKVVEALGSTNVTMTGHSLGGGLASTASIYTGTKGVTFNSAGVHRNVLLDALNRPGRLPWPIGLIPMARDGYEDFEKRVSKAFENQITAYRVRGEALTSAQEAFFYLPDAVGRKRDLSSYGVGSVPAHGMDVVLNSLVTRMDEVNGNPECE